MQGTSQKIMQNFYSLPQFQQAGLLYFSELRPQIKSPLSEKFSNFIRKKNEGTDLFKRKDYLAALEKYHQALALFKWIENKNPNWNNRQINDADLVYKSEPMTEEVKAYLITSYLNIAICSLKLEQWKEAELACDEVLKIDEKSVKALYRKAQAIASPALAGAEEYKKSMKLLKIALQMDPKNVVVWQKFNEIKEISEAKVIGNDPRKNFREPAPTPFLSPINELDDMITKWEFMVNQMPNSGNEVLKFQKNLEKIKKYKTQLRENLVGISEKEMNKLKSNKFGIDISDYIINCEIKEAKNRSLEIFRTIPCISSEKWEGWHYITLCFMIFATYYIYSLETKGTYF